MKIKRINQLIWASSSALMLGLSGCGGDNTFYDQPTISTGAGNANGNTFALTPSFASNPGGTVVVTGNSEAGSVIRVTFADGETREVSVDSSESYQVTSSSPQTTGQITTTKLNTSGDQLDSTTQLYTDVDAPVTPTASEVIAPTGFITVSGTAEVGSTARVTFPSGSILTQPVLADGTYEITSSAAEATSKDDPAPDGAITATAIDQAGNFSEPVLITISLADPLASQKVAFDTLIDSLEAEGRYVFGGYDATNPATQKGVLDHGLDAFNQGALKLAIDAKAAFDANSSQFGFRRNNCVLGDSDAIAVGCFVISGERIKEILGAEYADWDFDVSKRDLTGLRMTADQLDAFYGTARIYVLQNDNADKNLNDVWVSGSFSYPYQQAFDLNQVTQKRFVTLSDDQNSTRRLDFPASLNAEDIEFVSGPLSFELTYDEPSSTYTVQGFTSANSDVVFRSQGDMISTTSTGSGFFTLNYDFVDSLANAGFSVTSDDGTSTDSISLSYNSNDQVYEVFAGLPNEVELFVNEVATRNRLADGVAGTEPLELSFSYSNSKGAFTAFKDPSSVGGQLYQMGEGVSLSLALNDRVTTPAVEVINFALAQNTGTAGSNSYFVGSSGINILNLFGFSSSYTQTSNPDSAEFSGDLSLTSTDIFQFKQASGTTLDYECTINDIEFSGTSTNSAGVVTTEPVADLDGVDYSTGELIFN